MKTENFSAVLKHINKDNVELSSEKVELGLMQDFLKAHDKAQSSGLNVGDKINAISKELSQTESMVKDSIKLQAIAQNIGKDLVNAHKELGVDVPKSVQKAITGAKQWEDELKGFLKNIQSIKF